MIDRALPQLPGSGRGHRSALRGVRASTRAAASVLVVGSCVFEPGLVRAEPSSARYALSFEGSSRCGDPALFVARVAQEFPRAREDAGASVRVTIRLEDVGPLSRGTLRIGDATERQVKPGPCPEVLDAMALIVAQFLEPIAAVEETVREETDTGEEAPPRSPTARIPSSPPARPSQSSSRTWPVRPGIVAGGEARTGASPLLLFAGSAGLELRFEWEGWFSPSVRVEGSYGRGPLSTNSGAPWDFRLKLVRLQACPFHLAPSESLRWQACARGEWGRLEASPRLAELEGEPFPRLAWAGAGASISLEVPLVHWLSFEASASSTALFATGRFVESAKRAHLLNEVPPVVVGLSLGLVAWLR